MDDPCGPARRPVVESFACLRAQFAGRNLVFDQLRRFYGTVEIRQEVAVDSLSEVQPAQIHGLQRADRGHPQAKTQSGDEVHVLRTGDAPRDEGYRLPAQGMLQAIPDKTWSILLHQRWVFARFLEKLESRLDSHGRGAVPGHHFHDRDDIGWIPKVRCQEPFRMTQCDC